ncbi:MAG: hypothetical protein F6K42_20260 [Leptolyngbya sp. SIO1D8]|nr:hypothetical protein [Leptolyngbya sp. SIO1D8]
MTETPETSPEMTDLPTGPGVTFTFIYYFSGAALITTLLAVKTLGVGFGAGITGQLALLVGSVAGLLGTFYNRTKILEIPVSKPKVFARQLEETLSEMGYTLTETVDTVSVYQRSRFRRLFSGDIFVQNQDKGVVLVSRAVNIRTLEKRLG